MRQARIRPEDSDTFMHVFNRVTGPVGDYPFGRPEKEYSRWFNRTRTPRRRGYLWGNRFKSTILQGGLSVWHCWQYIQTVKTVVAKARGELAVNRRRLIRAFGADEDTKATAPPVFYSFRQLRRLV